MNGNATSPTSMRSSTQKSAADDLEQLHADGKKEKTKTALLASLESTLESVQLSDTHRLQKKVRKFAASLESPALEASHTSDSFSSDSFSRDSRQAFERLLEELKKSARKCEKWRDLILHNPLQRREQPRCKSPPDNRRDHAFEEEGKLDRP